MNARDIPTDLPFDVLLCIMEHIDRKSLCACARVSHLFHEVALPSLYKCVSVFVVRFHNLGIDKLDPDFGPFKTLKKYPHLKPFVKNVEICLGLNDYVTYRERLAPLWATLSELTNITSFSFWPPEDFYYHLPQLLADTIVSALSGCKKLEDITLLSTISAVSVSRFSRLRSIRSVRFGHLLSNETLNALGTWFGEVEGGFRSLSIMKAHAVGPMAMRQIVPYLHNLHTLHIGTSHSLSSKDLLALFTYTPQLRFLDITYYGSNSLSYLEANEYAILPHLEGIVIRHSGISQQPAFADLFGWIKLVIASGPLVSFSMFSDDGRDCECSDLLLAALSKKPALEILNLPSIPLRRQEEIVGIFEAFRKLEVLSVFVGSVDVLEFWKSVNPGRISLSSITTIYLRTKRIDLPDSYDVLADRVKEAMNALRGTPGHVHLWEKTRQGLVLALWTAGAMTDRAGLNLLKDEYPGMYAPFN
ncbi:hypothetical protein V5O48_001978 [Marasmius crinis-equi]|uniref:F-box domain-containing protein n=1 Tax=Marasmius crinis-equi TaxID=585013 RepID=A0ABR3FWY0_9AGAR